VEILGLIFEILFLVLGIYIYLFALGRIGTRNPEIRSRAEAFRKANGWWMRLLALALIAIMLVNIYFHLMELL